MMNYDENSRSATKGDKEAQRALMEMAEKLFSQGEFERSAVVFKDAAISYRIAAFRNSGLEGEARSNALWNEQVIEIYKNWIRRSGAEFEREHAVLKRLSPEQIRKAVVEQPPHQEKYAFLFDYLEIMLMKRGVEFYSPGGSALRYILKLLGELAGKCDSGLPTSMYSAFTQDLEIRVALDQIADEVVRRCESG